MSDDTGIHGSQEDWDRSSGASQKPDHGDEPPTKETQDITKSPATKAAKPLRQRVLSSGNKVRPSTGSAETNQAGWSKSSASGTPQAEVICYLDAESGNGDQGPSSADDDVFVVNSDQKRDATVKTIARQQTLPETSQPPMLVL